MTYRILPFLLLLAGCADHYVDWVEVGHARSADAEVDMRLTAGACKRIELTAYTIHHGAGPGDTTARAVGFASIEDASIATITSTGERWTATDPDYGAVFLACGVKEGTTTLHLSTKRLKRGSYRVTVKARDAAGNVSRVRTASLRIR